MSKVPDDPNMLPEVRRFLDDAQRSVNRLSADKAGLSQTDFISGVIRTPLAQDYRIVELVPYGMTLTNFTAKTSAGTVTATLKINSTAVTTGAINVTSTQASVTPSAANVAAENDALVLTLSSVSSALDLSFTIEFTRQLVE